MTVFSTVDHFYEFGGFRLDIENPCLWRGGEMVQIFPKALDVLIVLVRRRGEIVSRDEILEIVWDGTFVEESNITYTVSLLRKTLDENNRNAFVQTVPKRGYRFTAEVRKVVKAVKDPLAGQPGVDGGDSRGHATQEIIHPARPFAQTRIRPWIYFAGAAVLVFFFASGFAAWWNLRGENDPLGVAATQKKFRALAILPPKPADGTVEDNATALGLADTLISRLGKLDRFAVRPFSLVKGFAESGREPLEFGEQLKADAVLEGSLHEGDGRLSVKVRLWDVRDGAKIWEGSFESTEPGHFDLHDAISTDLARIIAPIPPGTGREPSMKRYTSDPEAYRSYIRGRAMMDSRDPDNFDKAIDEYQKAATLDPAFALAYVGFADAFTRRGFASSGLESEQFYARSKASAKKALELEPELAEAYAALGSVNRIHDWNWAEAETNFVRAIELNPNYAKAHLWYALLLSTKGRNDEALAEIERAIEIDPLSPDIKSGHLTVLEGRREYEKGAELAQGFVKFHKEGGFGRRGLAMFLFHLGRFAEVNEISEQELLRKNSLKFVWLSLLATSHARVGQFEKADEKLRQLEELSLTDTKALYSLAQNYTERGRFDEAIAVLQKCLELREERMMWLKIEPRFADLRNDPRFRRILSDIGLSG